MNHNFDDFDLTPDYLLHREAELDAWEECNKEKVDPLKKGSTEHNNNDDSADTELEEFRDKHWNEYFELVKMDQEIIAHIQIRNAYLYKVKAILSNSNKEETHLSNKIMLRKYFNLPLSGSDHYEKW